MEQEQFKIISLERVKQLVSQICKDDIDDDAAELLASMGDEVLLSIVSGAAEHARSREAQQIELADLQHTCEIEWGLAPLSKTFSQSDS